MNSSNFLESFVLGSAMLTLVAGNHAHLLPELGRTGNSLGNQFYTYTFMSPFFYIEIDVTLVNFVILFSSTYSGDDRVVTVLIGLERPHL